MKLRERFIDGDGSKFHVERVYDVEPVLNRNQRMRSEGAGKSEEYWHVGSIPFVVLERWAKEAGIHPMSDEMDEVIRRKLLDGDFSKLRVAEGKF